MKAINYSLSKGITPGGFVVVGRDEGVIVGAVVVNKTGMEGYIPENILVYIAAHREVFEETGLNLDKKMFVHQELAEDLRLYTYELDEMVHPTLNYEHTEWGYFKIDQIKISPTPIDEKIAERIQGFRRSV